MAKRESWSRLRGRQAECETLDRLVATVEGGHSSVLVVRGEAGIGKTALLEYTRAAASGCRIARAAGVESEMELAFGGLHQLCAPFLDDLRRLPQPQRQALETAFGLSTGAPPDRFLVGLAVLSLLANVADKEPLLCLVDDAQWLDLVSVQTLAFVARRLLAERVGLVFAVRPQALEPELKGLAQLQVARLSDGDSRALLDSVTPGRLDERVRDGIVAEAQGNPLALLELPRGLTPAELAGGFGLPDARPVGGRIEQSLLRQVRALPAETQRVLLVAAAEPMGDVALLTRSRRAAGPRAGRRGAGRGGGPDHHRHPGAVPPSPGAFGGLRLGRPARAAGRAPGAGRRDRPPGGSRPPAWHLAGATAGPDEAVAAELERSAGRAQGSRRGRGGGR
ncbi:AAA family ATPase, partial [Nonomuraea rubra]|uniref:AAA family ATPase n=1 Tax=Nonomuraea rubra TaxID=46180 RepID=UPI0031E680F3